MKHSSTSIIVLLTLVALALFLGTACSPSVVLKIKPDASGTSLFSAEMSTTAENLARRFSGTDDTGGKNPIFDKDKITISLAHAGVKVESLTFPTKTGIALDLSFLKLDGLLKNAIILKKDTKIISVTISRDSVNEAINMMPADTRDYLDLLMAPIFTGETLSAAEYEGVIGAAYGKTLVDELKKSTFTLTIHCPGTIQSAKISEPGKSIQNGTIATFTVPLSALLTLEKPLTASAEWK